MFDPNGAQMDGDEDEFRRFNEIVPCPFGRPECIGDHNEAEACFIAANPVVMGRDFEARQMTDREMLEALVEAADAYGRDTSDHMCSHTEHEGAFWDAVHEARKYLRAQKAEAIR